MKLLKELEYREKCIWKMSLREFGKLCVAPNGSSKLP